MPLSMMSARRLGRYSVASTCTSCRHTTISSVLRYWRRWSRSRRTSKGSLLGLGLELALGRPGPVGDEQVGENLEGGGRLGHAVGAPRSEALDEGGGEQVVDGLELGRALVAGGPVCGRHHERA